MNRPIGIIDSGVGGLTVASEVMRQLPNENIVYLGDTERCPYGSKMEKDIVKFTLEMVDFVTSKNIKLLIIACNTATAYTLDILKQSLDIPVIGVIQPGARAAINYTNNDHIAVIGTLGTISSDAYKIALNHITTNVTVYSEACPALVPLIEGGDFNSKQSTFIINSSLFNIKQNPNIDTLILGCTHYPIIKEHIKSYLGEEVSIVSSSEETARETSAILEYNEIRNQSAASYHSFYTTGKLDSFRLLAEVVFQTKIDTLNLVTIHEATIVNK